MRSKVTQPRFLDLLILSGLIWYVVSGMMLAPFHGDEATIIYLAKDWYRITSIQGLSQVFYREKIDDPRQSDEQEFRLQNGVVSKYGIGLVASLLGQPIEAMNDPWFWGADYNDNVAHGHVPAPIVLLAARLSSTLMLALSVALVYRISWRLRGRLAASGAAFVYATLPAVLLNGRRAMFEGATLLAIALVLSAGMSMTQVLRKNPGRQRLINWVLFGLACGFGIASKHSLLIVIAPVCLVLFLLRWRSWRTITGFGLAAFAAVVLFLVLNPAWWPAPFKIPAEVLRLRTGVLKAQVDIYGGYQNTEDRLTALVSYPLGVAQYFEDKGDWKTWIGDQITAYEASPFGGLNWYGWPALILIVIGLGSLLMARQDADLLVVITALITALALYVATPLPWQRYYLLLAPLWAIVIGVGLDSVYRRLMAINQRT